MNYKDKWQAVTDARSSWRKVRKAARKLRTKVGATLRQKNSWKASIAKGMRDRPTKCEAILYRALEDNGIAFMAQVQIGPYIADALILEGRTVVEVDGSVHDHRKDYDSRRDSFMWNARYRVIRFSNSEVSKDVSAVVAKIRAFMESR